MPQDTLPLQAVPPVSPWIAGADALRSAMIEREMRKQKALLDAVDLQSKIATKNKVMAETDKLDAETAGIPGAAMSKLALDAAQTAAASAAAGHNKALTANEEASGQRIIDDRAALQKLVDQYIAEPDPQKRLNIGMQMGLHGGKPNTANDENDLKKQHLDKAMEQLEIAIRGKDPAAISMARTAVANLGGKPDEPHLVGVHADEQLIDPTTGKVVATGPAKTSATAGNTVSDEFLKGLIEQHNTNGVPLKDMADVFKLSPAARERLGKLALGLDEAPADVGQGGIAAPVGTVAPAAGAKPPTNLANPTVQDRNTMVIARSLLPHVNDIISQAEQLNKLGLFGSLGGRWREFATGEAGVDDFSGPGGRPLTDAEKQLLGEFQGNIGFFQSRTGMAHAVRGGTVGLLEHMKPLLAPSTKDINVFLGNIKNAKSYLEGYAVPNGGVTPSGGAGATPDTAAAIQALAAALDKSKKGGG